MAAPKKVVRLRTKAQMVRVIRRQLEGMSHIDRADIDHIPWASQWKPVRWAGVQCRRDELERVLMDLDSYCS